MVSDPPKRPLSEDRIMQLARGVSRRHRIDGFSTEDVYMEVFVKMWEVWKEGNEEVTEGHLVNVARNHLRKVRRANRDPEGERRSADSLPDRSPSSLDVLSSEDRLEQVKSLLTPVEARIIELSFWRKYTDKDIAIELEITVKSVKEGKSRALKKLREALGKRIEVGGH